MNFSEITSEQLANQYWRLNNLYYIIDKANQKVKLRFNSSQIRIWREAHTRNLILKARQLGCTTFSCIYFLDCCLFNKNIRAGIIAHNIDDAKTFFRDKIKFAYDNLPEELRKILKADTSRTDELLFANNSGIRVSTSMRSGTLNLLLVSEFGKICAKYPDKAREIVTGAIEAVESKSTIFIESTAEGRGGYFHDYCIQAQKDQLSGRDLTDLDFKFFFFPWHEEKKYSLDVPKGSVLFTTEDQEYFERLSEKYDIELTYGQKAWYVRKKATLNEDMKREYPSFVEEAFESTIVGAYYARAMQKARAERRITIVPHEPSVEVNTFWDLGVNDANAIWFHQLVGREHRFIKYIEAEGEGLPYYVRLLREETDYIYGSHYFPHDIAVRELGSGRSRYETLQGLGLTNIEIVPRERNLSEGIEATRSVLSTCYFDESKCAKGIEALENYRKQWDEKNSCFKDKPLHDKFSNGADAFRTFARGFSGTTKGSADLVRNLTGRLNIFGHGVSSQGWMGA